MKLGLENAKWSWKYYIKVVKVKYPAKVDIPKAKKLPQRFNNVEVYFTWSKKNKKFIGVLIIVEKLTSSMIFKWRILHYR